MLVALRLLRLLVSAALSLKVAWFLGWYLLAECWPDQEQTADESEKYFWWYRRDLLRLNRKGVAVEAYVFTAEQVIADIAANEVRSRSLTDAQLVTIGKVAGFISNRFSISKLLPKAIQDKIIARALQELSDLIPEAWKPIVFGLVDAMVSSAQGKSFSIEE